jgi:uncharacterized membrane protein
MSEEVKSIQEYLDRLREELLGADPALVQDALYDAEEYLRNETAPAAAGTEGSPESAAAALQRAVQRFGSPREVAEAYRDTEARVNTALRHRPPRLPAANFVQQTLRVFVDPRAYGALLYMFLSLVTGIVYFVWAVTGLSLSLGLSVLIIGIPFALVFLASIRMFALLEGRIVESMLGVRMPRRPPFTSSEGSLWSRFKGWLADRRTWTTLLYMVLKLPLGIFSFTLFTVLASISLALVAAPFAEIFWDLPIVQIRDAQYHAPIWAFPLFWAAGLLDLLLMMHLARALGRVQGAIAKAMLVEGLSTSPPAATAGRPPAGG